MIVDTGLCGDSHVLTCLRHGASNLIYSGVGRFGLFVVSPDVPGRRYLLWDFRGGT